MSQTRTRSSSDTTQEVDRSTDHYASRAGLIVASELAEFVEREVLTPELDAGAFWSGYACILTDLMPENAALLAKRAELQVQIDKWLSENEIGDGKAYRFFLEKIGYLQPQPEPFTIDTRNVDPEIASIAGPQLVVPVMNARFALNAANARWGSLYDALYGTDAIPGSAAQGDFDPVRGAQVIAWARAHLDEVTPLEAGSWKDLTAMDVKAGVLLLTTGEGKTGLRDNGQFVGYRETGDVLLSANGLLIELVVDREDRIGADDPAGIADIRIEAALTVIQDCEDSVAAVDAEDKCVVYRNWLGLMKGDLTETFSKGEKEITRRLNPDVTFLEPGGREVAHPGRAVLLVRNVGHLMTTDAVMLDGRETPEGIMDAVITVACAMHDLKKADGSRNSRTGSIYVVKPKMHGPEEVAFADKLYGRVEKLLGLAENTVKLGVMDEERRTSANLAACIRAVRHRCVFINTGFLDRTGDEIHTSMYAGPIVPRAEMAQAEWLGAYEDGNVDTGLAAGLRGRAQIGKGMWAKPDAMAEMLAAKIAHPMSGANTAWVPSPTAAVLHATHYHKVDVAAQQADLASKTRTSREALLTPPIIRARTLKPEEVARELDSACQSILGYVVRWVDQGVGCSKVPDINDVALMEDRATLRISAQHLANWRVNGICTTADIEAAFRRMAPKVDAQNAADPLYRPMAPGFDGEAFNAARAIVLEGVEQPSGYTEPLLHAARRRVKDAGLEEIDKAKTAKVGMQC
ncbi:MAG: malate synthase G [Qingshengfaniella sp.]